MKTEGTDLLLLTTSAFWGSSRWPRAEGSRRQRSIPLGGRYRQVSLFNPRRRNKCAVFIYKEAVNDHSLRTTEPLIRCGWQQGIQNKIWRNRHWAALCCKPWFLSQLQVRNNASVKWHIWNYIYKKTQTGCMETEFVHYIWTRIRISGNLRSHIWTAILTPNDWFICKNVSHNLELPKWLHLHFGILIDRSIQEMIIDIIDISCYLCRICQTNQILLTILTKWWFL